MPVSLFLCKVRIRHAEAWQAGVWHMLVTDPRIMAMSNKWESIDGD